MKDVKKEDLVGGTVALDPDRRLLYLVGDIDERSCFEFLLLFNKLQESGEPIRIIMSSTGGLEFAGYAMYDAIRQSENEVIIEGYGIIGSIASAVFQAADFRGLSEHCQVMIHHGSIDGTPDSIPQDTIVDLAKQIEAGNKRY